MPREIEGISSRNSSNFKTLFLVGGLGSNRYLKKFLDKKLGSRIDVKQPTGGYQILKGNAYESDTLQLCAALCFTKWA